MASFSAISLDTIEHSDAIRVAWALDNRAAAWHFPERKTCHSPAFVVTTRYVAERTYPLPGPSVLALGDHLKIMRLVLPHFLSVLPDIMSARAHK